MRWSLWILPFIKVLCWAQSIPTYRFLTRTDIAAPVLTVETIDHATVSNGSIFVVPRPGLEEYNFTEAMYIYNNGGGLIWSGHSLNIPRITPRGFHRCTYQSAPHLCSIMFQGRRGHEAAAAHALIIDQTYEIVRAISPNAVYATEKLEADFHELNLLESGSSALLTSYTTVAHPATFSSCAGSPKVEYVMSGHFVEMVTDGSNATLFQWNALDHIPLSDTVVCPGENLAGFGHFASDGFDYFHINSVDKDEHGDYLVSARFTSTIYKIAGLNSPSGLLPGSIIWRLGGKQSTLQMQTRLASSGGFNFSFQHDARFHEGGITLWDNAMKEEGSPSALASSAMQVEIDEPSQIAWLTWQGTAPSHELDESQGNHQILPNANHFCGMGSTPEIFELTPDGHVAFDAWLGVKPMQCYRAFRSEWMAHPAPRELALFTFARNCSAPTAFYASWNGATEVHEYRFFASDSRTGPFLHVATARKGWEFEVGVTSSTFALYSYVVAIGANDQPLGGTPLQQTFVPTASLAAHCSDMRCGDDTRYDREPQARCVIQDKYNGW